LVFVGDEGYGRALAVAMHSAVEHLSPGLEPEVYVLDNGLSKFSRDRLVRVMRAAGARDPVRWIPVPRERLPSTPTGTRPDGRSHHPPTTYSRVLIPELLPRHVQRAVYLDADVLVRRDLSPLFRIALGEAPVAAVRDYGFGTSQQRWPSGTGQEERAYFNCGVLVMDLPRWRSTGLGDRVLEYAAGASESLLYADQDALNAVVDTWHELDYRWNFQQILLSVENMRRSDFADRLRRQRNDLYRNAAVLHFSGRSKPWYHGRRTPGTLLWVRGLMRTRWYSTSEALVWLLPWLGVRAIGRVIDPAVLRRAARRPAPRART